LTKKKTTTEKPSSGAIAALITTTRPNRILSTSTKTLFSNTIGKKSTTRATTAPAKG